jgi:hypothetical protein
MGALQIRWVISFGPKVRDAMSDLSGLRHPIQCLWAEVFCQKLPDRGARFRVVGSGSADLGPYIWFVTRSFK